MDADLTHFNHTIGEVRISGEHMVVLLNQGSLQMLDLLLYIEQLLDEVLPQLRHFGFLFYLVNAETTVQLVKI